MRFPCFRLILIISSIFTLGILLIFYRQEQHVLSPLIGQFYPRNFSDLHTNFVLLSCSSDSYTSVYCYYLPYVALAWRRIGFEPIVFLVGNDEIFRRMPLLNLLENQLKITYHLYNIDSSRSISTSQLIRLFGGFISYNNHNTTKDIFIIISDVDLIPISRHRFQLQTSNFNSILAVNAFCCLNYKFSFENYNNIHYYPISYIGMKKELWTKLFLPLNECDSKGNLTVDFIECCLKQRINETIPKNVVKAKENWDLDQRFLSILIARAQTLYKIEVDKRPLGRRLDPNKNFLLKEFDNILRYDDVHLPNKNDDLTFTNHTWTVFHRAFSKLFHSDLIEILSQYHQQTTAYVKTMKQDLIVQKAQSTKIT